MADGTPPQIQSALDHFRQALAAAAAGEPVVDPMTAAWAEIEKPVIRLLGGAFNPNTQAHQNLAFMIAATLAERIRGDLGGFWFQNRSTPEGASLGFPQAVIVFSPFGAAMQALAKAQLSMLETVTAELRAAVSQARPGAGGGDLGANDYQRLFDPGFVQFVRLDTAAVDEVMNATPSALARELEDAFGRLPAKLPAEVREGTRKQIVGTLRKLDGGKSLADQATRAPQLPELLALLKGAKDGSGFAPIELWEEVLLPLLHIGPAESFPPVDEEEREAWKQSSEAVLLYVDALPFKVPAEDEDGLLGVFPPEHISPIHDALSRSPGRMLQLEVTALEKPLASFDVGAIRTAVGKFEEHMRSAAGASPEGESEAAGSGQPGLLEIALTLLDDLQRVARGASESGGIFALRQATESEAASEPLLAELRKALTGPRIIMP